MCDVINLNVLLKLTDVILSLALGSTIGREPSNRPIFISTQIRIFLSEFLDEILQVILLFGMVDVIALDDVAVEKGEVGVLPEGHRPIEKAVPGRAKQHNNNV